MSNNRGITLIFENEVSLNTIKNIVKTITNDENSILTDKSDEFNRAYKIEYKQNKISNFNSVDIKVVESYFHNWKNYLIMFNLFKHLCTELKPKFAFEWRAEDDNVLRANMEYFDDARMLPIDCDIGEEDYAIINKSPLNLKTKELEKIKTIVKEKTYDSFTTQKGIGFLKIESDIVSGYNSEYVYPRYFIKKELRKLGFDIKEGLAEHYANILFKEGKL